MSTFFYAQEFTMHCADHPDVVRHTLFKVVPQMLNRTVFNRIMLFGTLV